MSPAKKAGRKKPSKPATKKTAKPKPPASASISDLHRMTSLDRGTILKRLQAAKIQPNSKKEYPIVRAMGALLADHTGIAEARRKQMNAKASLTELELARERGDLLEFKEVRDVLQKIFNRLFQQLAIQNPRDHKARYHRMKTPDQLADALKQDVAQVFNDLRSDFTSFL